MDDAAPQYLVGPWARGIYERLDEIDPDTFEIRAAELLHALGFQQEMIHRRTRDMSGGWRMRVALAKVGAYTRPLFSST